MANRSLKFRIYAIYHASRFSVFLFVNSMPQKVLFIESLMIYYLIASSTSHKVSILVNGCNAATHNSPTWSPSTLETMTSGSWNLPT